MSFSLTARSIELNGAWLTAKLLTKEGSWVDSALDLNKHIQNVDGAFDVTTTASGWAHSAKSQYLKGATLFAQLRTIQGHFAEETSVDLNLFVKNENGVLIFDRNCLHESLLISTMGLQLQGSQLAGWALGPDGKFHHTEIDLNDHYANIRGEFESGRNHYAYTGRNLWEAANAGARQVPRHFCIPNAPSSYIYISRALAYRMYHSFAMPCSDAMIPEFTANAQSIIRHPHYSSVKGVMIGTNCSTMHLVPVPFYKPTKAKALGLDAKFQCYIRTLFSPTSIVQNIDPCVKKVDRFPSDSPLQSPYHWLIFLSNHPLERVNMLLRSFHGAQNLYVRGSILVVKCDQEGFAVPVSITDYALIERMVLDTLARAQLAD